MGVVIPVQVSRWCLRPILAWWNFSLRGFHGCFVQLVHHQFSNTGLVHFECCCSHSRVANGSLSNSLKQHLPHTQPVGLQLQLLPGPLPRGAQLLRDCEIKTTVLDRRWTQLQHRPQRRFWHVGVRCRDVLDVWRPPFHILLSHRFLSRLLQHHLRPPVKCRRVLRNSRPCSNENQGLGRWVNHVPKILNFPQSKARWRISLCYLLL